MRAAQRPQKKIFDRTGFNLKVANDSDSLIPLNLIPLGVTNNERTGNKIVMTDVEARIRISVPSDGEQNIRIVMIHDRMMQGVQATHEDIWLTNSPETLSELSYLNPDNVSRFVILYDQVHQFGRDGDVTGTDVGFVHIKKHGLNIPVLYPTGDTSNPLTNFKVRTSAIYITTNPNTVDTSIVTASTRVKYYDA